MKNVHHVDFGPVPCCYQCCVDNNLYEYGGLDAIGLRLIREYIIENIMRNNDIMHNEEFGVAALAKEEENA